MTLRSRTNIRVGASNTALYQIWYFLDFMRTTTANGGPGWTVPCSSNGSAGGTGDYISTSVSTGISQLATYNSPTGRAWFCLMQPDGKRCWFFARNNTTSAQWWIYECSGPPLTDGDAWSWPTWGTYSSVTSQHFYNGYNYNCVNQFIADDASPYGWAVFGHRSGELSTMTWGLAQIPMDVGSDPDDFEVVTYGNDVPIAVFDNGTFGDWTYNDSFQMETGSQRILARAPAGSSFTYCPAPRWQEYNTVVVPDQVALTLAGKDIQLPVTFIRRSGLSGGFYKGVSSWVRWTGFPRPFGALYDSKSRICVGDWSLPWDGVSDIMLG